VTIGLVWLILVLFPLPFLIPPTAQHSLIIVISYVHSFDASNDVKLTSTRLYGITLHKKRFSSQNITPSDTNNNIVKSRRRDIGKADIEDSQILEATRSTKNIARNKSHSQPAKAFLTNIKTFCLAYANVWEEENLE
jgi:hypothetical protein